MYGGESEEMVGKAIAGRREDIVLATKASLPMSQERNHQGSSRRWLVSELDNSLRRLGAARPPRPVTATRLTAHARGHKTEGPTAP
jgi:aryl-alcohol dehydrogenase-like predicted oxidoreductase